MATVVVVLVSGQWRTCDSTWDLCLAAMGGLVIAVLAIGGLAWLRFALEQARLMPVLT
jgi:hypothetical protein